MPIGKNLIKLLLLFGIAFSFKVAIAQDNYIQSYPEKDTSKQKSIFDKDITELMKIPIINSASKKEESNIESPLSTTVITDEQIKNSGATTIEEVFRLVPGVIVREQSNGNFDIHIRGNDNVAPDGFTFVASNSLTLVMIDGRRVYNNMNGGTLWETLPVSLTDIKQIEIIRGPSTALYGPNAASGVINIITHNDYKDKLNLIGNVQTGTLNTTTVNLTAGSALNNNKWIISGSINYDHRNRGQETYYNYITEKYTTGDSLYDYTSFDPSNPKFTNPVGRWDNPSLAKNKLGGNTAIQFNIGDSSNTSIALSYQSSKAQSVFMESTTTPLVTRFTESSSLDYKLNLKNLHGQISYLGAFQDLFLKESGDINKYIYHATDANLEYDFYWKNNTIRPGIQFQSSHFDDRLYTEDSKKGIINGSRTINTFAYYLRLDIPLTNKLRLISALRMDHYSTPATEIFTYQFILSQQLSKNHVIRISSSKANRGPFIADLFADIHSGGIHYSGNSDLDLVKIFSHEIGYKAQVSKKLYTDLEIFYIHSEDFSSLSYHSINQGTGEVIMQWQNLPLKTRQLGGTANINYALNGSTKLTLFGTLQETKLIKHRKPIDPTDLLSLNDTITVFHKNTPTFYGGAYIDSKLFDKITVFANVYFYSQQEYWYILDQTDVMGKIRVDAKIAYPIWKENTVFINGRNIFNNDAVEFGFVDNIGSLYLVGLDIKL